MKNLFAGGDPGQFPPQQMAMTTPAQDFWIGRLEWGKENVGFIVVIGSLFLGLLWMYREVKRLK
jgi:hypothetical protein